jgi:hypothetical protein
MPWAELKSILGDLEVLLEAHEESSVLRSIRALREEMDALLLGREAKAQATIRGERARTRRRRCPLRASGPCALRVSSSLAAFTAPCSPLVPTPVAAELTRRVAAAEAEASQSLPSLDEMRARLAVLDRKKAALAEEITRLRGAKEVSSSQLASLTQQLSALKQAMATLTADHTAQVPRVKCVDWATRRWAARGAMPGCPPPPAAHYIPSSLILSAHPACAGTRCRCTPTCRPSGGTTRARTLPDVSVRWRVRRSRLRCPWGGIRRSHTALAFARLAAPPPPHCRHRAPWRRAGAPVLRAGGHGPVRRGRQAVGGDRPRDGRVRPALDAGRGADDRDTDRGHGAARAACGAAPWQRPCSEFECDSATRSAGLPGGLWMCVRGGAAGGVGRAVRPVAYRPSAPLRSLTTHSHAAVTRLCASPLTNRVFARVGSAV